MAKDYVRKLMGHYSGHFALVMCGLDHSAVDVHSPAGQRKRIDVARVYDLKSVIEFGMLKLRRNRRDKLLSDAFDISRCDRIVQDRQLSLDLGDSLISKLYIILD